MKIKYTFLVWFVLFFGLFLSRNAAAQSESGNSEKLTNENLISDQLVAQRTRQLMTHSFHGRGTAILGDNNQFFLINSNHPLGIMTDSSKPGKPEYWYVMVRDESENEGDEQADLLAEAALPEKFALSQNYPNPFNPSTTIKFQLPDQNGTTTVRTVLRVYDILGRLVRTIVDEDMSPGFYTMQWDGLNESGVRISSGVYFYSITAGDFRKTKKMLLIK